MSTSTSQTPPILPWDHQNRLLAAQVRPSDWQNPTPAPRYNLVVVGAGTAGLVTAAGAAGLGAKVALVEKHFMGGDCLNVGCVPSKAIIRAARSIAAVREASEFGVQVPPGATVDFAAVMERMRRLRAEISPNDSAQRFAKLGVDVFFGAGKFTGAHTLDVAGQTLSFSKAVIATGARAAIPEIPGIQDVPFLTNETLFSLTELPRRLGIIGAGPVGCEMAQSFARFGAEVFLINTHHGILAREDSDAAEVVKAALVHDGVRLLCCAQELQLNQEPSGIRIRVNSHGRSHDVTVDQLLVATGRAPNVEGLNLEGIGVAFDRRGVQVNDRLQTTRSHIFACGDVCSRFQFTHAADFMARIVIQNALFSGRAKASSLIIPWCTYTSPELAHVGLEEMDAKAQMEIDTFVQPLSHVDRAILDGQTEGFVKIHVRKGTDTIVGATVVADHAGDLISELTLAMKGGLGLRAIGSTIHPYPTQGEAIRKVGDLYNRTRLTPLVKKLMGWWLKWQRS